ncbi:MAG: hypothetical protein LHV69_08405 [Elusimicrobia bacterium]|nr:hypothetical protein [Candidatus Obscuribacterium magneticum]
MKLALWEIFTYVEIPLVWYLFKHYAKRNVLGDIIAGTIVGVLIEFITEPLWNYHFVITYFKDTPVTLPTSWGITFAIITYFSERLYCKFLEKDEVRLYDKRILVFDLVVGIPLGLLCEIIGLKSGIWEYNYGLLKWNWGEIPFVHMPYEALVGYALLMLSVPTFVRYWQGAFEGKTAG